MYPYPTWHSINDLTKADLESSLSTAPIAEERWVRGYDEKRRAGSFDLSKDALGTARNLGRLEANSLMLTAESLSKQRTDEDKPASSRLLLPAFMAISQS